MDVMLNEGLVKPADLENIGDDNEQEEWFVNTNSDDIIPIAEVVDKVKPSTKPKKDHMVDE